MSEPKPKSRGGHWKRPPTKVYDYNYDVGQHYYKPMLSHLDKKHAGVETELPGPRTFAERLATDPLYGKKKDVNYVESDIPKPSAPKGVEYDDEDRAFKKRLDDILGDYKKDLEDEPPKRSDRYALPSISDHILDNAGLSKMRDSIDDRLAEARRRPFRESTPTEDIDSLLKRAAASRGAAVDFSEESFDKAIEESLSRRRNLLKDLNSELAKIDSEIDSLGSSRQARSLAIRAGSAARAESAAAAESVLSSSARMSASSSTSLNVKQRRVRTTVTTETVRC